MRHAALLLGVAALAGLPGCADDGAPAPSFESAAAVAPSEVLVKFRRSPGPGGMMAAALSSATFHASAATGLDLVRKVALPPGQDAGAVAVALAADPAVEWAQPNHRRCVTGQVVPNDPRWGSLWGMQKISAPGAWSISTASPAVVVGVIDTGIDRTHEDLTANLWTNPGEIPGNGVDDDGNGFVDDVHGWDFADGDADPMDDHGHGTHVAGTIGAAGNNGIGVAGLTWSVRMMAVKVFDAAGVGFDDRIAEAIVYAADNGAMVTNNSWGGDEPGRSPVLEEAFAYAMGRGGIPVCAAGNSNVDAGRYVPGNIDGVIIVGASDWSDARAWFSNWGDRIDVVAPGVSILSTYPGNRYVTMAGTSMACPHVAGLAALLLSRRPLDLDQVRQVLRSSSDDVGATGFDGDTGHGRINAHRAMAATGLSSLWIAPGPEIPIPAGGSRTLTAKALDLLGRPAVIFDPLAWEAEGGALEAAGPASVRFNAPATAGRIGVSLQVSGLTARTTMVVPVAVLRGDMNGDGACTASDIVMLMNWVFTRVLPPAYLENGDLDGDGLCTPADIVLQELLTFLGETEGIPPVTGPGSALDEDGNPIP